jgi:hypothetical protein
MGFLYNFKAVKNYYQILFLVKVNSIVLFVFNNFIAKNLKDLS